MNIKYLIPNKLKYIVKRLIYLPLRFSLAKYYGKKCSSFSIEKYKHIMVVIPHPDDEILGFGGGILECVLKNVKVTLVYVTRGEHSIRNQPEEIIAHRNQIRALALDYLGLKQEFVQLDFEDGNIPCSSDVGEYALLKKTLCKLCIENDVDCLLCTSVKEPHKDHVAIGNVVRDLASSELKHLNIDFYEYFVWSWFDALNFREFLKSNHNQLSSIKLSNNILCKKANAIDIYFQKDANEIVWSGEMLPDFQHYFRYSNYEFLRRI